MNLRSTIIGIAASAIILVVLGLARLFTIDVKPPDLTIRGVETVVFEPPLPPPPVDEPPPDAPPPPPALTEVSALPDPTRVPIPQALVPMDITAPVENFFTDLAPAPLPVEPEKVTPRTQPPVKLPPKITTTPQVAKTHYNSNELDSIPRLLRKGTATFPVSLARQGVKSGTVTLEVELSTTGSVTVRSVISSSHKELIESARKVAIGSRYTSPKRNGQAVKAIMRLPIVIQK